MKVDLARKLHQKKHRAELGYCLVEGEHLLQELEQSAIQDAEIFVTEAHQHWSTRFRLNVIGERQMSLLSDTRSPQGMVAAVSLADIREVTRNSKVQRELYLYQVQDPGNLGTILRTLGWFGGWKLVLSPDSVDPFNAKVLRSTMGAIFHVPLEIDVPLDDFCQRHSQIATLDMGGASLTSPDFRGFTGYLFGNEARGVPNEQLAGHPVMPFSIAGNGAIESLNLASAVNMAVYELSRG